MGVGACRALEKKTSSFAEKTFLFSFFLDFISRSGISPKSMSWIRFLNNPNTVSQENKYMRLWNCKQSNFEGDYPVQDSNPDFSDVNPTDERWAL